MTNIVKRLHGADDSDAAAIRQGVHPLQSGQQKSNYFLSSLLSFHLTRVRNEDQTSCCRWNLCLKFFFKSLEARNRVGIGLSYRPARLHRLAESIPGLLKSFKIPDLVYQSSPPLQQSDDVYSISLSSLSDLLSLSGR
jgi:hypothetical protein